MAPGFDDSSWPLATVVAQHPDSARAEFRRSPLPTLTQRERRPQALIDAGVAQGGGAVTMAEDVARRMCAQTHTSLVRPPLDYDRAVGR